MANKYQSAFKAAIVASRRLASMNPQDEACESVIRAIISSAQILAELSTSTAPVVESINDISGQVNRLKTAAIEPARRYARVVHILDGLQNMCQMARKPQNKAMQPKVASIVKKVAGIFSEVDTVADLDKPLEAIERAIQKFYGDQSKNDFANFSQQNWTLKDWSPEKG